MAGHTGDGRYVGQPLRRQADRKLVTGRGTFVDDLQPAGCLYVAFVRSPFAHAEVVSIDTDAAASAPGVVAVITGAEVDDWLAPLAIHDPQFLPDRPMARRSLAPDKARFAGDARDVLGADRACSYMRKFYPWYLAGQPVPSGTLEQMLRAPSLEVALELLHDAAGTVMAA